MTKYFLLWLCCLIGCAICETITVAESCMNEWMEETLYWMDACLWILFFNPWKTRQDLEVMCDPLAFWSLTVPLWRQFSIYGFFLACKDFGGRFDDSLPTLFFCFVKKKYVQVVISSLTPISLSKPGSVHSGSASWDNCGWVFPDELRVSLFP